VDLQVGKNAKNNILLKWQYHGAEKYQRPVVKISASVSGFKYKCE
jgi:hypothetical protein